MVRKVVVGLITHDEQEKLFEKLLNYYRKLYPGVNFKRVEKELTPKELDDIYYTYPGEEAEATSEEKKRMIAEAIGHGYDTPIVILRKKKDGKDILLDGHRRVQVALSHGLGWKAIMIIPDKELEFGIESMIMGKVKDLFK